ncbi:MAG: SIMPL domain-containing protein [Candidatus Yanofskybacteria bacterium]|nr:SIMPL domain-containing protein [Candidatus Yanofskybacteria bacterium]
MDNYTVGRRWFWVVLNIMLASASVALLMSVGAISRYGDSLISSRIFYVSAEGKAVVSPDIANLSFSVVSEGKDPAALQEDNAKKMRAAIDYVKSQGVDKKDIKTAQYDLQPRYEYDEKTRRSFISGYTFTQTVFVKVRQIEKAAPILGGLPERGINQIGRVSFDVDNPDTYLADARNEAFGKARAKAEEMARANGLKLGRIVNVSETGGPRPYPVFYGGGKGIAELSASMSPPIEPGTQEVTVQVSIAYELK